jgi:hypothetical protein
LNVLNYLAVSKKKSFSQFEEVLANLVAVKIN